MIKYLCIIVRVSEKKGFSLLLGQHTNKAKYLILGGFIDAEEKKKD